MPKRMIIIKLKDFIYREISMIEKYNDVHEVSARCYGALMFVLNFIDFDQELVDWWSNEILPIFRGLERR